MAAKEHKIKMSIDKTCKASVRYANPESDVATNVYISNSALEQMGNPEKIEVTIKAAK